MLKENNLFSKAILLSDLIDYQNGSIVSRTLFDKETGTITLFAFDENQALSEHTAPFDALVYNLDGEAEVIISGNKIILKKGEIVIMPANISHSLKATKRFKMLLTLIK